jgi:UDP-N-acetyl-D-mannosaminuronic acid transferase (WecB/TagA/CpsF family)
MELALGIDGADMATPDGAPVAWMLRKLGFARQPRISGPAWMRANGLEWLHRLGSEPRRLWRRYLVTNTLFILGAARQLWFGGKGH